MKRLLTLSQGKTLLTVSGPAVASEVVFTFITLPPLSHKVKPEDERISLPVIDYLWSEIDPVWALIGRQDGRIS